MTSPRRGRRPGAPDTRAGILTAARELFAAQGFAGTSIRAVAASAGVDAALVHHYFGSKDDLFVAALELPVDPRERLAEVVALGPDGAGERMVRVFLSVWDDPDLRLPLVGLARSILDPSSQRLLRDGFVPAVLQPVGVALGIDRPDVRMPLVASQVIGLILTRYVLEVEPIASLPADDLVAIYGPTVQRYLTGPLS
ncbi:TetR family transcriptional regulator [Nocardioides sp. Root1257]|uniref:TetR/AcrR family transcriptional regulator n=1 Tax=unclassified Nocardioides TaxID=2615069 RepID=UPI0006F38E32|nr:MULTISPECIES: TetR family transcriptional regulator [unclassified Nocardioides]KQW47002.1 TetR family transcriptional regulator [Nocardioides sp. Root1257]KRC43748.1 TetR family transcriptional regulator [Nocardioides sp. Root224]